MGILLVTTNKVLQEYTKRDYCLEWTSSTHVVHEYLSLDLKKRIPKDSFRRRKKKGGDLNQLSHASHHISLRTRTNSGRRTPRDSSSRLVRPRIHLPRPRPESLPRFYFRGRLQPPARPRPSPLSMAAAAGWERCLESPSSPSSPPAGLVPRSSSPTFVASSSPSSPAAAAPPPRRRRRLHPDGGPPPPPPWRAPATPWPLLRWRRRRRRLARPPPPSGSGWCGWSRSSSGASTWPCCCSDSTSSTACSHRGAAGGSRSPRRPRWRGSACSPWSAPRARSTPRRMPSRGATSTRPQRRSPLTPLRATRSGWELELLAG